jgi:hypothetical protein
MPDETFYDRLPVLNDFTKVADPDPYAPVPSDWLVAVGDVRNSTGAIDEGQYKDVNVVGASVIVAVLNAVGRRPVPYVFAGDGASLCVPGAHADAVRRALGGTRRMAADQFGLRLDVGLVPVADLVAAGHTILVARYRLADEVVQAVFLGTGLEQAEAQVKADPDGRYGIAPSVTGPADFEGLECRWDQVPSPRDETVALLVRATADSLQDSARVYEDVLARIADVYGTDDHSHPIRHSQLRMPAVPGAFAAERRVRTHDRGWGDRVRYGVKVWIQSLLGRLFMAAGWSSAETNWGRYRRDLVARTDFRKMDGTLRQVIAGTRAQRRELDAYLQSEYERGRLAYGLDVSAAARITCLVFQYEKQHVHFVDGADGGYAHAARALKERLAGRPGTGGRRDAATPDDRPPEGGRE